MDRLHYGLLTAIEHHDHFRRALGVGVIQNDINFAFCNLTALVRGAEMCGAIPPCAAPFIPPQGLKPRDILKGSIGEEARKRGGAEATRLRPSDPRDDRY